MIVSRAARALGALTCLACGTASDPAAPADPGCGLLASCPDYAVEKQLCPGRIADAHCRQAYEEYLSCYAAQLCGQDAAVIVNDPCAAASQPYHYCRAGIDGGG